MVACPDYEKKPIDASAVIDIVTAATKGLVTEAELCVATDALMHEPCNMIELSTEEEEEAAEDSNYQVSIRYRSCVLAALRLEGHLGTMGWSDFRHGISNTKRRL